MSSPAKAKAARINGAKSRGPVTDAGKNRSSRNAVKHGLTSKLVVLDHEDREAYEEMRAGYFNNFRPASEPQARLVDLLAATSWRQQRIVALETDLFNKHMSSPEATESGQFALATAFEQMCQEPTMALLIRYEGQLSRLFDRILKELRDLQKAQPNEPSVAPVFVPFHPEPPAMQVENAITNPTPPPGPLSNPFLEPLQTAV